MAPLQPPAETPRTHQLADLLDGCGRVAQLPHERRCGRRVLLAPASRDDEERLDDALLLDARAARLQRHCGRVGGPDDALQLLEVPQRDEEAGRAGVDEAEQLALDDVQVRRERRLRAIHRARLARYDARERPALAQVEIGAEEELGDRLEGVDGGAARRADRRAGGTSRSRATGR